MKSRSLEAFVPNLSNLSSEYDTLTPNMVLKESISVACGGEKLVLKEREGREQCLEVKES